MWNFCCQKQVSQAGIFNCIPQYSVWCNYLSMPEIPAYLLWQQSPNIKEHTWTPVCCLRLNIKMVSHQHRNSHYKDTKFLLPSYDMLIPMPEKMVFVLTQWGRDKMDAIWQRTFSNAFSWMKMFEFQLKFHWSLFPRVQFTILQQWIR